MFEINKYKKTSFIRMQFHELRSHHKSVLSPTTIVHHCIVAHKGKCHSVVNCIYSAYRDGYTASSHSPLMCGQYGD